LGFRVIIIPESRSKALFVVGIKLLLQGSVRAFWDEQRAYTKGTAGKLSHRNAEVCLDEMVNIASRSTSTHKRNAYETMSVCLSIHLSATSRCSMETAKWLLVLSYIVLRGILRIFKNKLHRLTERDSSLTRYFAPFWGFGATFGLFSYFGCKI